MENWKLNGIHPVQVKFEPLRSRKKFVKDPATTMPTVVLVLATVTEELMSERLMFVADRELIAYSREAAAVQGEFTKDT